MVETEEQYFDLLDIMEEKEKKEQERMEKNPKQKQRISKKIEDPLVVKDFARLTNDHDAYIIWCANTSHDNDYHENKVVCSL